MKIFLTLAGLIFSTSLFATPLDKFVVFGDSLSDTGNLYKYMQKQVPSSPPYYKGRFTNGPLWIDLLLEHYYPKHTKKHLENYAYGGAGVVDDAEEDADSAVFTLNRELNSYFIAHHDKASPKTLFVMWIGSNNYLALPDDHDQVLQTVTGGIVRGIQRLIDHGAKNILVVNLPDIGLTPAAHEMGAVDALSSLSIRHNSKLYDEVKRLQAEHSDIHWVYLDVNEMFSEILAAPAEFGFTNTTDTCFEEAARMEEPSEQFILKMAANIVSKAGKHPCDGHLFFDPVHPAAPAHRIMFKKSKNKIKAAGIEFEPDVDED